MNKTKQVHGRKILFIISLLLITSFCTTGQEVIEGLEFSTSITGSGIENRGTKMVTKLVITSRQNNVQICGIVPEKSPCFKKVKLDRSDTLTIVYCTSGSHLNIVDTTSIKDTGQPEPICTKKGRQKTISFSYHPPEFKFHVNGTNSINFTYKWQEKEYVVILPEHQLEELLSP